MNGVAIIVEYKPLPGRNDVLLRRVEAGLKVHRDRPGHDQQHAVFDELCKAKRVSRGAIL